MLNGYRILLLLVILIGLVLIYGYQYLTFGAASNRSSHTAVPNSETLVPILLPLGIKSRTSSEKLSPELSSTTISSKLSPIISTIKSKVRIKASVNPQKMPSPISSPVNNNNDLKIYKNNTAKADVQNIIVFNRIPKTGSEMFEHFGKLLASVLGYRIFMDPQIMTLFPTDIEQENFAEKFYQNINDTGIYFRHMAFYNFTEWNKPRPIYVSVLRHPIERIVSWFYYQRWKNRPDDKNADHLCDQNSKWKIFCQEIKKIRQNELQRDDSWYNLTFDECVEQKLPECTFYEGNGYLLQKDFLFDFRSQMMFFCGNSLPCSHFNSERVLNIAKQVVEETYSVVGILEDMNKTLKSLEGYVPRFFTGASKLFDENISNSNLTHTNQNPNKKPIKNSTRKYLESKFSVEIEFYEFCQQRLNQQVQSLREKTSLEEEKDFQNVISEAKFDIQAEDYVLL